MKLYEECVGACIDREAKGLSTYLVTKVSQPHSTNGHCNQNFERGWLLLHPVLRLW